MTRIKVGVDVGENEAEPRQFIECGKLAEKLGFDTFWFGDHFMPWIHTGGKSAFVWSLMASTLEATEHIQVGPDVTSPIGGRYHPALIAQAAATLDNAYPGRFLLGVGSGEAVNEARFFYERGDRYPSWRERVERTAEGVTLMRKLWTSDKYFSFDGRFFKVRDVFLYTKPKTNIPVYFSALGPKAAVYAGRFGDHLVTIASPEKCRNLIFPKFAEGVRKEGKDLSKAEKMVLIGFMLGDPRVNINKLRAGGAGYLAQGAFDEPDPRRVESMAATVSEDLIRDNFALCPTIGDLVELLESYIQAGADNLVLGTGAFPETIRLVGQDVLPSFR